MICWQWLCLQLLCCLLVFDLLDSYANDYYCLSKLFHMPTVATVAVLAQLANTNVSLNLISA